MKLLLCTPYLDKPDIVPSGIGIWARNILNYYHSISSEVQITPVSFDRKYNVSETSTVLERLVFGIRDYFSAIKDARKQLTTRKFDVLHLCTSAQLSLYKDLLILKMAKRYGAKAVVHFHFGRIPELINTKNSEYRILMKVCKAADSIIVMDKRSEEALQEAGFNDVHNLPNPLSMEIMDQIQSMEGQIERVQNKLLFVGSVIKTKGVYELVEACKQFDNIQLHIVGSPEEQVKADILNIASIKNKGEWMKLKGQIPHDEVLREMMSASVFVFPSYTEGFPNVILEAMACGCPIVTTTVGAIPEMLDIKKGEICGICVPPQDVEAFANGVNRMLNNPAFAKQCAVNANKRVQELYAVPVVWKQLTQIWDSK